MSGPIVRKYGFPNFEKIFGKRAPQHGIDDEEATPAAETKPEPAAAPEPEAPATKTTSSRSRSKR